MTNYVCQDDNKPLDYGLDGGGAFAKNGHFDSQNSLNELKEQLGKEKVGKTKGIAVNR